MRGRTNEEAAMYTGTCPGDVYARAYPVCTTGRSNNLIFDRRESGRKPPPVIRV
ncbi:hypothetical protein ALC60_04388 [Trachymyrmex zeteki]|uniref:Uncharacterized protein n=1 Tax=Mycetomoellerius zeteki TaxID=64791 RepID=A0A151X927_9HYME|nr:hypothetical protein ALC60_04388 [Trachymyrmex zeteki]